MTVKINNVGNLTTTKLTLPTVKLCNVQDDTNTPTVATPSHPVNTAIHTIIGNAECISVKQCFR